MAHLLGQGLVQADWVGGDAAYGNSPALRQALQQRGQAYVLDVGPGLQLYLADGCYHPRRPAGGTPFTLVYSTSYLLSGPYKNSKVEWLRPMLCDSTKQKGNTLKRIPDKSFHCFVLR